MIFKKVVILGLAVSWMASAGASPAVVPEPASSIVSIASPADHARDILAFAMDPDGELDEAIHRDFWLSVRRIIGSDPVETENFRAAFQHHADRFFTYHRETWRSARASREAGKVVRTRELERLNGAMADDAAFASLIAESEKILVAAAGRTPYVIRGMNVDVNEGLIDFVLDGVDRSVQRVHNLLDPAWKAVR